MLFKKTTVAMVSLLL